MPVLPSHSLKIWLPWLAGLVAAAVSYLPLRHLLGRPRLQKDHPSEPMKQPATDDTKSQSAIPLAAIRNAPFPLSTMLFFPSPHSYRRQKCSDWCALVTLLCFAWLARSLLLFHALMQQSGKPTKENKNPLTHVRTTAHFFPIHLWHITWTASALHTQWASIILHPSRLPTLFLLIAIILLYDRSMTMLSIYCQYCRLLWS